MYNVWCLVPNLTMVLLHTAKHPPMAGSQACFTCSMANIAAVTQAAPCTSGAVSWHKGECHMCRTRQENGHDLNQILICNQFGLEEHQQKVSMIP